MPWAAAAAVAGAVITSSASKSAANSAADAQTAASDQANATQQAQYEQTRVDQAPWREAGANALSQLASRTGQGGDLMRSFGASDFTADPGYQFRMDEGMKGINNSAAARGGVLSGAALKAASKYNQNFASNEYGNSYNRFNTNQGNQFNRLASIAGVGQTAVNQVGAAGQNMANNVSQNQLGAGNARASGYIGGANALSGGVAQGYNMYQNQQMMNSLSANKNQNDFWGSNGAYQNSGGYYPAGGSSLDVGNMS